MLGSVIRSLVPWRRACLLGDLLYPALLLVALVAIGRLAGLIAIRG